MAAIALHLTFLCAVMVLTRGVATAEMSELRAKAAAVDLVRMKMGFDSSHQLRATRREDWEDDLFRLQVKIKGQIAKAAYFFEVTESGYFVLSPEEAVYVSTADGERLWTVAVPLKGDASYGLYGFPEGETGFRGLVSSARLDVRSEADAEAAALLFFTTVKDPREQTVIFKSRQLKHKVENFFLAKLPEPKADSRSLAWWREFTAAKLSDKLGVKSARTTSGYAVSVTHIRSEDNMRLELARLDLRVSSAGACEVTGTALIYRPSER
jgi:hypothetical protein